MKKTLAGAECDRQPEQEPVKALNDQFIFNKLNGIFGDPKHHTIPITKGQIVEFGRKMFELGTRTCTTPPQHALMAEHWKAEYDKLKAACKPLTDEQTNKAAMKLAECMDYPWTHMPEEGKQKMRAYAKEIIEAAHGITASEAEDSARSKT